MGHLQSFAETEYSQDFNLMYGVGRLVCAWGALEQALEDKLRVLRQAAGDVRTTGRTKPGMGRLIAELRAMISMRDRRNLEAMGQIAEIERDIQRIDRFRGLIISGFGSPEPGGFSCRDQKNNELHVSMEQLEAEVAQLERLGDRMMAL
ncbi:MAG: hypothetical protein DI547_11640 [Sphingobium sp.]|nr:MAG: hypothetical protein DI547_11640 [Sphingobium sp.]